jgi:hypothetical protein
MALETLRQWLWKSGGNGFGNPNKEKRQGGEKRAYLKWERAG